MAKIAGEQILLYGIEDKKKEQILKSIFIRLGARIRVASKEDCGKYVGILMGLKDCEQIEEKEVEPIIDEMLVLHGFSSGRLDLLLKEMKRLKVRISLKAVVTEHNKNWTLVELYEELKREREKMES